MNKEEDTSELEFLASMGFGAGGAKTSELDELKRRWTKRHRANALRNNVLIALVSLTLIALLLWFNQKPNTIVTKVVAAENPEATEGPGTMISEKRALDTVLETAELFVRPAIKTMPEQTSQNAHEQLKVENLTALQTAQLPINELREEKLKFMINSPIFYIHDLKVSNYQLLYFRKNKFVPAAGRAANIAFDEPNTAPKDGPDRFLHETLAEALLNYKRGLYLPCVTLLNEVATFNTDDINCDFYRGMSWYRMKHYDKAIVYFSKCEEALNNAFLQEAQYYRALCYQAIGEHERANALFKKIVEEGEFYAEKAREHL